MLLVQFRHFSEIYVFLCLFVDSGNLLKHPGSPLLPLCPVFGEQSGPFFVHLSSMSGGLGFSLCCGVDHGSPSWRNGANLIAFMLFAGDACFEFVPAVSSLRITAVRTALTIAFGVLQKKVINLPSVNI